MSFALRCFDMRSDPDPGPAAQSMSASTVQVSSCAVKIAAAGPAFWIWSYLFVCQLQVVHACPWTAVMPVSLVNDLLDTARTNSEHRAAFRAPWWPWPSIWASGLSVLSMWCTRLCSSTRKAPSWPLLSTCERCKLLRCCSCA